MGAHVRQSPRSADGMPRGGPRLAAGRVVRQQAPPRPAAGRGRMLADPALLRDSAEPQVLAERFERYRIANALAWLDDLDARLPDRSASAVRVSLRRWESWVAGRSDPVRCDRAVIRAL